jgi:hypothetical protein
MVSQKQYDAFRNVSDCYLSYEDFGVPEVENVMSEVFLAPSVQEMKECHGHITGIN